MTTIKPPKDYLHNSNLLREILLSQKEQERFPEEERDDRAVECLTPTLVRMIMELVSRYATSYRWRGYTWIEDMESEAVLSLCRVALKFNLEKAGEYPNPFGYYTQIVKRVFLTYIEREKKQGKIRDDIIEMSDTDLLPSFARQNEGEDSQLDGTQAVVADPKLRRRSTMKKIKVTKEDDTSNMTAAEQKAWMDKKIGEFREKQEADARIAAMTQDIIDNRKDS